MKKYFKYLSYLARHKWYVLLACWKRGLYWQGLVHDWSKFLPSEFVPYMMFFYGMRPKPSYRGAPTIESTLELCEWENERDGHNLRWKNSFDHAWLAHQHRQPHHWQHWILVNDDGSTKALEIPNKYRSEMIADWEGAGRAITGKKGGTRDWYLKNYDNFFFADTTRWLVNSELNVCHEDIQKSRATSR